MSADYVYRPTWGVRSAVKAGELVRIVDVVTSREHGCAVGTRYLVATRDGRVAGASARELRVVRRGGER